MDLNTKKKKNHKRGVFLTKKGHISDKKEIFLKVFVDKIGVAILNYLRKLFLKTDDYTKYQNNTEKSFQHCDPDSYKVKS